jgi:predicted ester cyclase
MNVAHAGKKCSLCNAREKAWMDDSMAAQENVALARSVLDLYNNRQSDPAWLDKSLTAFAADAEYIDIPSGAILRGPDGYKRLMLFFVESFPDMRAELIDMFATEDRVALEGIWRWNDTSPLYLPSGALPGMSRSCELRCCFVLQIRNGKIVSLHCYYDMMTQLDQLGLAPITDQAT